MLSQYKDGAEDELSDVKEDHARKMRQLQSQIEQLEEELKSEKEDVSKAAMVKRAGLPRGCGTSL